MAPRGKVAGATGEAREELKAILLADSFAQHFRPVTVEQPKVLLPLVNVPLIEYTLEWLASNKVEEVYVICCTHAEQIERYIAESRWLRCKELKVTVVKSSTVRSVGDALRHVEEKKWITSDFVLVAGDVVTNMNLATALDLHRARREKDRNAIMTMVMKHVKDVPARRLGYRPILVGLDPASQRLLRFQEGEGQALAAKLNLDAHFFGERDAVQLRTDLVDCHIAICAHEVLLLFQDNFDYQNLRRDFVPGVLSEEELGNKLYVHTLEHEYGARVLNLRSYDALSRDVMQRWTFPFVPDTNLLRCKSSSAPTTYCYSRHHVYREQGVTLARDAVVGRDCVVGAGTYIDEKATVLSSVIGRGCRIGPKARIQGSYIHDGVTVWEGAVVEGAMLCEGAVIMPGAVLGPGTIISYKVVVGKQQLIGGNKRLSLCQQSKQEPSDSDDEREFTSHASQAEDASGFGSADASAAGVDAMDQPTAAHISAAAAAAAGTSLPDGVQFDASDVGNGGAGFVWQVEGKEDELEAWSLAPPSSWSPADDASSEEASVATMEDIEQDQDVMAGEDAQEVIFKQEVSETLLRCVADGYEPDLAIIELNSLKIAEDRTFADVARYVFSTILSLCLPLSPKPSKGKADSGAKEDYNRLFPKSLPANDSELLGRFKALLEKWGPLLQRFLKGEDEQVDLLLTLEEFCAQDEDGIFQGHGGKRFVPVFQHVLKLLYDNDVVTEQAFLDWADEKEHSEEDERYFLKLAAHFITWLREADEESEDGEESE